MQYNVQYNVHLKQFILVELQNSQQGLPNLCTNVGQIYNITVQLAKMLATGSQSW